MAASLLFEANAIQRALANGSSLDTVPNSPLSPQSSFEPSSSIVWVNALWMLSLTLSLLAALLAVIAKQWLRRYMENRPTGSVQERARVRQFRFMALWRWHVFSFVGGIPVIVHVAVALFLVGLTILLASLHPSIAYIVGALTAITFAFYIISQILPLLAISCPYHTPFSEWLYWICYRVPVPFIQELTAFARRFTVRCDSSHRKFWFLSLAKRTLKTLEHFEVKVVSRRHDGLSAAERHEAVCVQAHYMTTCALDWLHQTSHNASALRIVSEAVGALSPIDLREHGWSERPARILKDHHMWTWTADGWAAFIRSEPTRAGRLLRAKVVISSTNDPGGSHSASIDGLSRLQTKFSEDVAISATCAAFPFAQSDTTTAGIRTEPGRETRRRILQKEIQVDMTPHFWATFLHNIREDFHRENLASRDEFILSLYNTYVYGTNPALPIDPNAPISLSIAIRSFPAAMAAIASTFHSELEPFQPSNAQAFRPTDDPHLQVYIVECFLLHFLSRLRRNPPPSLAAFIKPSSIYPIISELVVLRQQFLAMAKRGVRDVHQMAAAKLLLETIDSLEDPKPPDVEDLRASLSEALTVMSTVRISTFTSLVFPNIY